MNKIANAILHRTKNMVVSFMRLFLLLFFLFPAGNLFSQQAAFTSSKKIKNKSWSSAPFQQLVFVENKGQWDKKISFGASRKGVDIYFTENGVICHHDERSASADEKET